MRRTTVRSQRIHHHHHRTEEGERERKITASSRSWERHTSSNRSVIVDMFHGQYESAVQCVRCNVVSRTYDPFMYLSLPLPQQSNAPKFPIVFLGIHEHARLFGVDPNEVRENGVITAIGLKRFVSQKHESSPFESETLGHFEARIYR